MRAARRTRLRGIAQCAALLLTLAAVTGCTDAAMPDHVARPAPATAVTPASAATAVRLLAGIAWKGRAPLTGYDRDAFGTAWTDDNDDEDGHNGCDTRNDILRRDLVDTSIDPDTHGCVVLTGVLHDPYTGATIDFTRGVSTSLAVQVDHVVSVAVRARGSRRPAIDVAGMPSTRWRRTLTLAFDHGPYGRRAGQGPARE